VRKRAAILAVLTALTALFPAHCPVMAQEPPSGIRWEFNESSGKSTHDAVGNLDDAIEGFWWRVPGVEGNALQFDGSTTRIVRAAGKVPRLKDAFTVSAWVALNNYPWNWVPIADQEQDEQVGFFFGIDALGHPGFNLNVGGVWQSVTSPVQLPLKRYSRVTATFDAASGIALYVDGKPAGGLSLQGEFVQATGADLIVGRVRTPQLPYPSWLIHPRDAVSYSLDGYLDNLEILPKARSAQQERVEFERVKLPAGDVIGYAVLPSGPPGNGPFGAFYATLKFERSWDRARRLGPESDVVVRFEHSPMRLVFWQGTNFVPAWVTENGKWYTDEFLETWGPLCVDAGDCEPMSDKQSRYSRVSILESSAARAVVHWRYALVESRNYKGAGTDPATGWFDWADEYWTVYPDGVAVRKQLLSSSNVADAPHEWQETIVINGPGQRPEDNIEADALTLENMAGETATYHWSPKADSTFSLPQGPEKLDKPRGANIQVVHLKSSENPFQIVWPRGVSFDTYNGEKSYSMFEWWNHWPVAQIDSSGRPAMAADRPSHTSLSHIYWDPYEQTEGTETKLMLCGLTALDAPRLLPLARSWLSPPPVEAAGEGVASQSYDPAQRAFFVHRNERSAAAPLTVALNASQERPLVHPALVIENWNTNALPRVLLNGKPLAAKDGVRMGLSQNEGVSSLVVWLPLEATSRTVIQLDPLPE
jgi:hypothetical protein